MPTPYRVLLLTALALVAGQARAATPAAAQLREAGFKLGPLHTTAEIELANCWGHPLWGCWGYGSPRSRSGITGSVYAVLAMGGTLSFQGEAGFARKGYITEFRRTRMDYLEVPLLLRADLPAPTNERIRTFFQSGIAPAVLVACRSEETSPFIIMGRTDCAPATAGPGHSEPAGLDVGLVLGAGFGYGRVFLEGRHTRSLGDAARPDPDVSVSHRAFGLVLGYGVR
jgi:hypothetical protein